ncbi:MAG: hypothetical protein H6Q42_4032, partial [Deltaproteobacteria bacterium]|nr:hypothetical protein [Deltaproteobacteria bacterium]
RLKDNRRTSGYRLLKGREYEIDGVGFLLLDLFHILFSTITKKRQ